MTKLAALRIGTAVAALSAASVASAQTTAPAPAPTAPTASTKPLKPVYRNVRSFYRNVRSFWGEVNPFYRNVRSFWGDVDPFYRNVRSFWGTMDPATMAAAAGAPTYVGVGPFWEGLGTQWEGIATQWQTAGAYDATNALKYATVTAQLRTLVGTSETFWGAAVTKATGKSFSAGFANPLLARYGIDLNNPASLASLPANEQSHFFMDWYDGLMAFSGTDAADHWMKSVNWTPRLTQIQGSGSQAVIGLVDQFSALDADTKSKLIYAGGTQFVPTDVEGAIHGAGVLSLINASHDGKGVMGIAPNARVAAYNPFDAQGGADWAGVQEGIRQVGAEREINGVKTRASVVNLSLGAPGTTLAAEWRTVFKAAGVDSLKDKVVYVIAAGNDGHRQVANIDMKDAFDSTFIVVGSVDPTGKISTWSNTPGNACLTEGTDCKASASLKESGYLKNRFITAPGELILVSDGKGGVTRQSGTSLAAPLVAGAIALIHDRWPWFKEKPRDVAQMILGSARDVGAPGIDDVYGVGILDVEGAQAPLNFDVMKFMLSSSTGTAKPTEVKVGTLENTGIQSSWTSNAMYFTAFEKVIDAERDFLIPLSSTLYGSTRGGEYFQDFVYARMTAWIAAPGIAARRTAGFSDLTSTGAIERPGGWSMAMRGRVAQDYTVRGDRRAVLNSTVELTAPEGRFGFSAGMGDGALALAGSQNLGMASDFEPGTGGGNPLLGFASGGSHLGARVRVAPALELKAGMTEHKRGLGIDLYEASGRDRATIARLARYRAQATNVALDYRPAAGMTLSVSATRLHEPNAFLGVRTSAADAFGDGTVTTGATIAGDAAIAGGLSLFGSATASRSSSGDADASLRVRGARGTAFQAGIAKQGLLGRTDSLRLSLARPLATDRGYIERSELQVIDRQTGQQGVVTERFALDGVTRRLVLEGLYGTPLLDGRGQLGLFGRGELRAVDAGTPNVMMGGQFRLAL